MTTEPMPRPDVLAERLSAFTQRFDSMERRLEYLATKDELVTIMSGRDALTNGRLTDLAEDIRQLSANLQTERGERQAADQHNEERINRARTFALTAVGVVISVILGLIALINQLGGRL